jgi:murein DD-endopeptidase MepM/ murein hydrolase activator NlpD
MNPRKKNTLVPKPYAKNNVDRWSRLTGYELDSLADYTRDQLRSIAYSYGIKNASRMSGTEVIDLITNNDTYIKSNPNAEKIPTAGTETAVDTRTPIELALVEEIKKPPQRNVNHPKLYPELQHIKPRYMWGQRGLYDLEFKSDIDKAIYFAGAASKDREGYRIPTTDKKLAVREWIFAVTGLSYHDDYDELKEYRKRILEYIVTGLRTDTIENDGGELIIPPIYDGPFDEPDKEEDYDEEEEDDQEPEGLDDLLDFVKIKEEPPEDEKEVEAQATVATQVLVEAENDREEKIDESILDDLPPSLRASLAGVINKKLGKPVINVDKKSASNYISNKKIYDFLTTNIYKINGQLDSINRSIQTQTELVRANLALTASIHENLNLQNDILSNKLDSVLKALDDQQKAAEEFVEDEKNRLAEKRLEGSVDVAGVEVPTSTLNQLDKSEGSLVGGIAKLILKKFGKKLLLSLGKKFAPKLTQKLAPLLSKTSRRALISNTARRVASRGLQMVGATGASKALQQADAPAARALGKSNNIFVRALASPKIQQALVKKLGKEGAEKLTLKIAGKLVPGIATAYGLGEGIARIAMGDVKGGFLSFGSAIPVAGWGFAAVDILRDIDINAYTRHIESNLPNPSDQNYAAFFADALGITEDQYETGTEKTNSSKTVMLHGTELLLNADQLNNSNAQAVDPIGGYIVASTTQYINSLGSVGASIAPMFESAAAPLAKVYDIPSVLVQTNVGGMLPSTQQILKNVRDKNKTASGDKLSAVENDLLNTKNSDSFADKLLKVIDSDGNLRALLQNLNNGAFPVTEPGGGITGDLKGNIINPMETGDMQNYALAKFGADRRGRPGGHMGRDIMGPPGMKVVASLPGEVTAIMDVAEYRNGKGWSKRIDIKHANGIVTKYMHVDPSVKVGDTVNAGQKIAVLSPEDRISSGSHLHFEIWHNGVAQNPESFLKKSLKLKDIQAGKVPGLSVASSQPPPTPTLPPPTATQQAIPPNQMLQGVSNGGVIQKLQDGYNGVDNNTGISIKGAGSDTQLIVAKPGEIVLTPEDQKTIHQKTGFDVGDYVKNRKSQFISADKIKTSNNVSLSNLGGLNGFNGGGIIGGIRNLITQPTARGLRGTPLMRIMHGTSSEAASSIRATGFRGQTGMLGPGVYGSTKGWVADTYRGAGTFRGTVPGQGPRLDMLVPQTSRTFRGATVVSPRQADRGLRIAEGILSGKYKGPKAQELLKLLAIETPTMRQAIASNLIKLAKLGGKSLLGILNAPVIGDMLFPEAAGGDEPQMGPDGKFRTPDGKIVPMPGAVKPKPTTSINPPPKTATPKSKFYTKQGKDKKADTQILMIPVNSAAGKKLQQNPNVGGQKFTYNKDYNVYQTQEVSSATRSLLLRRLGLRA